MEKNYIHYISNNTRRIIYSEILKYINPKQVKEIIGEHQKSGFWQTRARVADDSIEKLLDRLPNDVKLRVLNLIEEDIKRALDSIEEEKKKLTGS